MPLSYKSPAMVGCIARSVNPKTPALAAARQANPFFHSRSVANASTTFFIGRAACAAAAAVTFGNSARRNGLVARSAPIVDGSVGNHRSRLAVSCAVRARMSALFGSTAPAKRKFASVYSCPQYMRVFGSSAASFASDDHI